VAEELDELGGEDNGAGGGAYIGGREICAEDVVEEGVVVVELEEVVPFESPPVPVLPAPAPKVEER